ncbi:NAC domain-containing protein 1-like [Trifolium pratense]|uniref:NAC domain-containing protein 1-like n=1 Tax=Trifolium pratense TaxID=57577 RepID=UPI001E6953F3|nr:NAC domain-containing protein 1-like [Trifolium pratense]
MAIDKYVAYDLDGCPKLPVGFRFDPIDDILVNFYLKLKVYNQPLPFHAIQEFDVFQTEPWMLPYDRNSFKDRKYYFFDIRNRRFQNMDTRVAGNGEWRTVEKNKELVLPSNYFIGRKNTLVYWRIQGNEVVKTQWVMHEFRIGTIFHPIKVTTLGAYRIFKMKVAKVEKKVNIPTMIDFTMEDASSSAPPPSP